MGRISRSRQTRMCRSTTRRRVRRGVSRPCGFCAATWLPDGTALSIIDGGDARSGVITGSSDVISLIDPTDGRALARSRTGSRFTPDHIGGSSWSPDGRRLGDFRFGRGRLDGPPGRHGQGRIERAADLAFRRRAGRSSMHPGRPMVRRSPTSASMSPDQDLADVDASWRCVDPDGVRPSRTIDVGDCATASASSPDLTWSPDGRTIAVHRDSTMMQRGPVSSRTRTDRTSPHVPGWRSGPLAWRPIPSSDPN